MNKWEQVKSGLEGLRHRQLKEIAAAARVHTNTLYLMQQGITRNPSVNTVERVWLAMRGRKSVSTLASRQGVQSTG